MRKFGSINQEFWAGVTGRSLRGCIEAFAIGPYLIGGRHSNAIGVFHCPAAYIAHDLGIPSEGASKGLRRLSEGGFVAVDESIDFVWVINMARYQIGEALKAGDNNCAMVRSQFAALPQSPLKRGFYERYSAAYHLPAPVSLDDFGKGFERGFGTPFDRTGNRDQEGFSSQDKTNPSGGTSGDDGQGKAGPALKVVE